MARQDHNTAYQRMESKRQWCGRIRATCQRWPHSARTGRASQVLGRYSTCSPQSCVLATTTGRMRSTCWLAAQRSTCSRAGQRQTTFHTWECEASTCAHGQGGDQSTDADSLKRSHCQVQSSATEVKTSYQCTDVCKRALQDRHALQRQHCQVPTRLRQSVRDSQTVPVRVG
jgi:hypothetical protein